MNEVARVEEIAAPTEPKICASEERERVIDSVAGLLSSGRPLSEILQTVKLLADRTEASQPNGATEPDTQTAAHIPGESRTNRSNSEISQLPRQVDPTVAHNEVRDSAGGLTPNTSAEAALAVDPSGGPQSMQVASIRGARHIKLFGLLGAALFWLIPAFSLAVVVVAGKSLVDADAVRNGAGAAARSIIGIVQRSEDQPILPGTDAGKAAAKSLVAEADRADQESPSDRAEPQTAQPDPVEPQIAQLDHAEPSPVQPDRAEPRLTSEKIRALLDRGDAFVSTADVEAARLFYERAAAAGNAEAAVRLGATFDPAFLTRAGLRNVRGDVTAAQYWYRRARDLEPNQSQLSLQGTEMARASEPVVTGTPAEPATEAEAMGQAMIPTTDRAPAKSIRPMPRALSSQTRRPNPLPERHTRNHRPTNGPRCPHFGHCLTPP
jgi:hypothetical protein